MNPDKMTAPVRALFDLMLDGHWHESATLISHGASICAKVEREAALKNGRRVRSAALKSGKTISEADLIASGAKDIIRNRLMIAVRRGRMERNNQQYRMTEQALTAWRTARGTVATTAPAAPAQTIENTRDETETREAYASVNVFGGIPEGQGWMRAPRRRKDRVHFRLKFDALPLAEFKADMPTGAEATFDEESGLYRLDVEQGRGEEAYTRVANWCAARGYETKGLRIQPNIGRRDLNDLDPAYLSDLCAYYHRYCRGQVRKHASTLAVHFQDRDDQDQQVFEWILEAIALYDETSGVPFGAFLVEKVRGWVHDLNRSRYGRHITEQEMRQQRARNSFAAEHGREPNESEMARLLGQDLDTYREKAADVASLRGLRAAAPLTCGADGESEIPLAAEESVEDRHEAAMRQSMITQMLTKACDVDKEARGKLSKVPNILGWVTCYETNWHGKSKVALAGELATSTRNMSQYTERAQERMRDLAADLLD